MTKVSFLESNIPSGFQPLRNEIYATITVLEAQENCQTVNLEKKIENANSAVKEIIFAHVTNSLARAEKNIFTPL